MTLLELAFWVALVIVLAVLCVAAALLAADKSLIESTKRPDTPPWPPTQPLTEAEPESRRLTDQVAHPAGRHSLDGVTEDLDRVLRDITPLLGCSCRRGRWNPRCALHRAGGLP